MAQANGMALAAQLCASAVGGWIAESWGAGALFWSSAAAALGALLVATGIAESPGMGASEVTADLPAQDDAGGPVAPGRVGARLPPAPPPARCSRRPAAVATPGVRTGLGLAAAQLGAGAARGLLHPLLMAESLRLAPERRRGLAMGVYQSLSSLGMLFGPSLAGVVGARAGLAAVFHSAGWTSAAAAALAAIMFAPQRRVISAAG